MKQASSMREAGSMLKERLLDRRVEKLARENDKLRDELNELKHDLDSEQERTKETLTALSKARKPGRMKWLVLAGGAYVLGAKAGRARYEQMADWVRSMRRQDGNGSPMSDPISGMSTGTTGTTGIGSTTGSTTPTGTGSMGTDLTGSTTTGTTGSSSTRGTSSTRSTGGRSTGTGSTGSGSSKRS
jgi:hypothetical protein